MVKVTLWAPCLLVASVFLAAPAMGQGRPRGLPSPELITNANKYEPPMLTEYAAKLAAQPDMTGVWSAMQPANAGVGPTFDPVNTFWGPQPVAGEAGFGPIPGTYLTSPPYTPEYKKLYESYVQEAIEGKSRDTFAACVPYGVPRMIGDSPVPFDIIQSPEVMFWYNNYGRTERRIFLDGRKHPTPADAVITDGTGFTYSGHSIGYWEGKTLVVDTANMLGHNFDETQAPYSEQLHMVERMRLIDTNILEIEMTFTDPVAFTRPWVVTRYFQRGAPPRIPGGAGVGGPVPAPTPALVPAPGVVTRGTFINLNDRPCVPNVELDEDGFQVILLPQEIEARNAAKAKAAAKSRKKKR